MKGFADLNRSHENCVEYDAQNIFLRNESIKRDMVFFYTFIKAVFWTLSLGYS
jgi:hypothetical protein